MLPKTILKNAAVELYATTFSQDARRLRESDNRNIARCKPTHTRTHLKAAINWLCRAQDMTDDGGVPAMYSLLQGWVGSYPETTGYIMPTMFDAAATLQRDDLRERATEMANWLLECQNDDGSFPGMFAGCFSEPRVFNTGQTLFGLHRAFVETQDNRYLTAATDAADWLCDVQDADGAWRQNTLNNIVHAYNIRTAWALALIGQSESIPRYVESANANALWTIGQQNEHGYFANNTFCPDEPCTNLHTTVYALRGLLETGHILDNNDYISHAIRTADALHNVWQNHNHMAGAFKPDWTPAATWRCLTGEAQLVVAWARCDDVLSQQQYRSAANALLDRVKSAQLMDESNLDLCGGVTGSYPVNGGYERYCVINWAAKFLADACMIMKEQNDD